MSGTAQRQFGILYAVLLSCCTHLGVQTTRMPKYNYDRKYMGYSPYFSVLHAG